MKYNEALKYIYSRELFGVKLGLKNITNLLENLGNPQNNFKSIHVAGTNGKGSTCAFISSVLQKQGYKVGVYTSPHLVDFRERIRINGKKIPKKDVAAILAKIKPFVKEHTFFEIVTALAFFYFSQEKVDFAVIEVGLGGRLDATNTIIPEVSVITNVDFDHLEHLGETIDDIAFEKAGIIKEGVDAVTSENCRGLKVIKKICKERGCRLYLARKETGKGLKMEMHGNFQKQNASLALKALEILRGKGHKISAEAVNSGMKSAKWPGRLEFIKKNLIFDCAHNPAGAKALANELKKFRKKGKNIYLVIGIMKDKDIKGICSQLAPLAKEIIITKAKVARAAMPEKIAKFIPNQKKVAVVGDVAEALEYARLKAGKDNLAVLSGSIFTVGEAFARIRPEPFNNKVDKRSVKEGKSNL